MFRLTGKIIIRMIYIDEMYINCLFLLLDGNLFFDSGKNMIKYVDLGNYIVKDTIKSNKDINYYMNPLESNSFFTSDRKCIKNMGILKIIYSFGNVN